MYWLITGAFSCSCLFGKRESTTPGRSHRGFQVSSPVGLAIPYPDLGPGGKRKVVASSDLSAVVRVVEWQHAGLWQRESRLAGGSEKTKLDDRQIIVFALEPAPPRSSSFRFASLSPFFPAHVGISNMAIVVTDCQGN